MNLSFKILVCATGFLLPMVCNDHAYARQHCEIRSLKIENKTLSKHQIQLFVRRFKASYRRVCQWFGIGWPGVITIKIIDGFGPSMALIPAWRGDRGLMVFHSEQVNSSRSAISHELVHLLAPNGSRFLAEGLAVHLHDALGGQSAFPNFGIDLDELIPRGTTPKEVRELALLTTPRRLKSSSFSAREAYIIAGSFVRFLLVQYGCKNFVNLYARTKFKPRVRSKVELAEWHHVYQKSFEDLVRAWLTNIRTSRSIEFFRDRLPSTNTGEAKFSTSFNNCADMESKALYLSDQ